jgi:hypothetical protein
MKFFISKKYFYPSQRLKNHDFDLKDDEKINNDAILLIISFFLFCFSKILLMDAI